MERLLAMIGLTYLSVLAVVFYLNDFYTLILGAVILGIMLLFLLVKKYRKTVYLPVIAVTALIACVINISYTTFVYDKTVEKYSNTKAVVTAVLKDEPYKYYGKYYYKFECKSVNCEKADFKFTASHSDLFDIDVFDEIEAQVELFESTSDNNIADGYFITADFGYTYPKLTVTSSNIKPPYYYAVKLRQTIREFLKSNLNSDAYVLCSALFLGDKYLLSENIKEAFTHAGVSHIIVVSGMHFSILFGFCSVLSIRFYRRRAYFLVPALVLAFVYMALTGFAPSVLRSGIMMVIYVIGLITAYEAYAPNSLGLAGILITIINGPYIAGDIGLILSFATTFSIVIFEPKLYEKCYKRIINSRYSALLKGKIKAKSNNKIIKYILFVINRFPQLVLSLICVNISAYLAALPLSIIFFHSAPTLSVFSGFVLAFLIEALLPLIVIMVLISFLPFVTVILAFIINSISDITLYIVDLFANIPFSYVDVTYKYVCLWVFAYILLLLLLWLFEEKYRFSLFTILVTILFLVGYITASVFSGSVCKLYVYDVSNGLSVVYSSKELSAVLNIDSSSYERNSSVSKIKNTVPSLEFAATVNVSNSGRSCMESLCEAFAIDTVLLYDTKRTVHLPDSVGNVINLESSKTVEFSDGSKAEYIMADDKYFVYFTYSTKSLLIVPTGADIENLEEKYTNADTIILCDAPQNFELLSCDTLVISADESVSYNLMKLTHSISNRVLLACEGDIKLVTEV